MHRQPASNQQGKRHQSTPVLPQHSSGRADIERLLAALRQSLQQAAKPPVHLATRQQTRPSFTWKFGLDSIDRFLPESGLAKSAIHDIAPNQYGDFVPASGFALALAIARLSDPSEHRPLLWCRLETEIREYGRPYGHGLEALGLPRARFLTVTLKKPVGLFWTMEEALKSGCLAVVIGDASSRHADLTTTRRLALAAQAGRAAGLLVFTNPHAGATSSHTRWRVTSARSQAPPFDPAAPGTPTWAIELTRARGGRPGQWTVSWHKDHATHRFHLVPGLSGGALQPRPQESAGFAAA